MKSSAGQGGPPFDQWAARIAADRRYAQEAREIMYDPES
jgi:hypothetical protein